MILCIWHVRRAWLKNVNRLASSSEKEKEMFNELGNIMKSCSNDEVDNVINGFFTKFATEGKFLDYFHKNWVAGDKICKFACYFFWSYDFCLITKIYIY